MKTSFSLALLALLLFSPAAFAKEQPCCWIDVKTGKRVGSLPVVPTGGKGGTVAKPSPDGKTAFNPITKQNFALEPDGCWIDVKTGKRVGSLPVVPTGGKGGTVAKPSPDGKTAFNSITKQNFALEPCPPPGQATGDTLKKVFDSVHIGIGIGGGYTSGHDEHHHAEDRHRTAEKVSTDKTKTHKTSPTTTHKTVTSACKCHPCTCAPCRCR